MEKGSFKNMKKQNQKNILTLIKNEDGISRAQIAEKLDVSRATVTNIVRELVKLDLVEESKMGKSRGGRRPMLLKLNPEGAYVIGIEWGIEAVKAVLINIEAEIIAEDQILPPKYTLEEYKKQTFSLIKKYQKKFQHNSKIIGIGLGIHGLVDPEAGRSIFTPHFEWGEVDIKSILAKKYDYPIFIDNDVRMMAAGEIWQGRDDFIFINTGSGIGAALVFKGELYYGNNYAAGEFGHMKLTDKGPVCHCGKSGCLEALSSKESIISRYQKLKELSKKVNFNTVMQNYQREESEALLVVNDALKYFGRAISDLVNILNPEAVIIGGLFAEYKDLLIEPLYHIVAEESLNQAVKDLKITTAHYQNFAGAAGAAEKVLNNFFELNI
ncbi:MULTISPECIES: ROK family transcriptional regulator [Halanaerobium]|jgi:predicted NBD/HSP70 family sugar kinase|uniref:Sugar kinase of the NBD/HSP70 family, may contain an N-terminal HTH domain n=1 Tax=Halanaerobium kushneri TaxID=56779 RepID=A0A1N6QVP7_9FIRM|nr:MULTISPECIES: ROK family transcriptional regulator [Halanaerobium]RCW61081.1 putative NBD/HSP70 family sugar kinase [Halanaerobium sp. ST460_2HS_T2]SIQ20659.1 Sugar kinase of the NBD/HSP70 family, may contain an N-terminal HTH domain [Halanaerobium kushneri]